MQSLQQKQRYLRDNITEEQYESFYEYIMDRVGNLDIDKWSSQFVVEMVAAFQRQRLEETNALETSFYAYQHAKEIKEVVQQKEEGKLKISTISEAEEEKTETMPKSALSLFDSVFEKANNNSKNPGEVTVKPKGHQTQSQAPVKPLSNPLFDNGQFWTTTGNAQLSLKPKADFNSSFDFWSQPAPKSAQQFKTSNLELKPHNRKFSPIKDVSNQDNKNSNKMPNFDELLIIANSNKQKLPSPYLKKNYVDETSSVNNQNQKKQLNNLNEKSKVNVVKVNKVIYDGEIILKSQFRDNVKCFPSALRSQLKTMELYVRLEGHQIINRTFLVPDYVMYSIRVQPINILIKRNYEDFTRLRATLEALYPGIKLAYLQKNSWFSSTSIDNIKRQKVMLQFFLNDIIKNKEFKNSRILEDFLTLPEHKKIKRKFEEYEKLEKPKSIEQLCLIDGKVGVILSQSQRLYQQNLKKYHEKMVDLLDRYERLNMTLLSQYKDLSQTLTSLQTLSISIIEQTRKFNQRVFGLEISEMEDAFAKIKNCYAEENSSTKFCAQLINLKVLPFINYEKENLKQFSGLINTQQSFFKSYLKRNEYEKIDENMPYTSDKIKNSKIGILQESKNFLVFKYQVGYLSNQVCNEAKRVFELLAVKFSQLWKESAYKNREQAMKTLEFWKAFCSQDSIKLSV